MLYALELKEGVEGDGYKTPNKDWTYSIITDMEKEFKLLHESILSLESTEFYLLSLEKKLCILKHLCLACYDCTPVRTLLNQHYEERNQSVANLNAVKNSQKRAHRQVSAAISSPSGGNQATIVPTTTRYKK